MEIKPDRGAFWKYCQRVAFAARDRAKAGGFPYGIDAYFIDQLLVDQNWCCAVSGLPLNPPSGRRDPLGPSLDRIVPVVGYVPGNVRVVNNLINSAMQEWGQESLMVVLSAMVERSANADAHILRRKSANC